MPETDTTEEEAINVNQGLFLVGVLLTSSVILDFLLQSNSATTAILFFACVSPFLGIIYRLLDD
jgi:hypothetical protein